MNGEVITTGAVQFQKNLNLTEADIERKYRQIPGIQIVIWLKKGLSEDQLSFRGLLPGGV